MRRRAEQGDLDDMTDPSLRDIRIPMRDGVEPCADVWFASQPSAPVLLTRLPYGKDGDSFTVPLMPPIERMTAAGYAVVVEECRGTFGSDGDFRAFEADVDDGRGHIHGSPLSRGADGRVGMFGSSYLGYFQWMAAALWYPSRSPSCLPMPAPTVRSVPWHGRRAAAERLARLDREPLRRA